MDELYIITLFPSLFFMRLFLIWLNHLTLLIILCVKMKWVFSFSLLPTCVCIKFNLKWVKGKTELAIHAYWICIIVCRIRYCDENEMCGDKRKTETVHLTNIQCFFGLDIFAAYFYNVFVSTFSFIHPITDQCRFHCASEKLL